MFSNNLPNPYFSGGKRRRDSMHPDSRSTLQPFLMGGTSSARSPTQKRTRVSVGGANEGRGSEVEWSSLLNFQTPLRPTRQRSTTLRRRETIHALPGQPGGLSSFRGGVMNASPGFVVRDRNERQSVARALHILDSRKRLRELSSGQCPEEHREPPQPTPSVQKKRRRLTINGTLEDMLQQEEAFASTSLGEIAGRRGLDASLLQKRCFTSVVPGAPETTVEPSSKRLRPGAPSSSVSTSASSVKEVARPASESGSSASLSQSDAAQRRRLLSFMAPAQVEARYARQSAANELLTHSRSVSRSTTPSVSRRVSQVGTTPLNYQLATTSAQTELSCNQKEELHKSPSKEEAKEEVGSRSRHCQLSVAEFVKHLDQARTSGGATPQQKQQQSDSTLRRSEVDSQARRERLDRLRKLLSDVTREPTPPASNVPSTVIGGQPTAPSSLLPGPTSAAVPKQLSFGFGMSRAEAAGPPSLPSLGTVAGVRTSAVTPTWSVNVSSTKPTPVIAASAAPVAVAAPTAVSAASSQPTIGNLKLPQPGLTAGVQFGAAGSQFNLGQVPLNSATAEKPANKVVAFGEQKKVELSSSLAFAPPARPSTGGVANVTASASAVSAQPFSVALPAAPKQAQPAFAFGMQSNAPAATSASAAPLSFGIQPTPGLVSSAAPNASPFNMGKPNAPQPQTTQQIGAIKTTPFTFGQASSGAEAPKNMSAAVPAVVQKSETSKPGNAEVKPGMFSFGAKSVAASKPSGSAGLFGFGAKSTTTSQVTAVTSSSTGFFATQQGQAKPATAATVTTAATGLFQFGQASSNSGQVLAKNSATAIQPTTATSSAPFSFAGESKKAVSNAPPNAQPFSFGQAVTANGATSVANTPSASFVFGGAAAAATTKPSGFTFGQQASAPTASFSFGASSKPTPPQPTSQQPAQAKPNGVAGFTFQPPPAADKPKPTSGFAFGAAPTPASAAPFAFGGNAPASPQPTAPGANLFSQTAAAPRKKNPLRKRSTRK